MCNVSHGKAHSPTAKATPSTSKCLVFWELIVSGSQSELSSSHPRNPFVRLGSASYHPLDPFSLTTSSYFLDPQSDQLHEVAQREVSFREQGVFCCPHPLWPSGIACGLLCSQQQPGRASCVSQLRLLHPLVEALDAALPRCKMNMALPKLIFFTSLAPALRARLGLLAQLSP